MNDRRPLRIVILGSSTAAGVGADPPEMAWAHRFGEYLKAKHPESELINLAVDGLQTFHLVPTEHRPPPARPQPDPERNISRAIALQPDAVIVQTPSNDAAAYYEPTEQLANFDLILFAAAKQGVPVWLCAPQPRRFSPEQVRIQRALRQAMQARYGPLLIDAWEHLDDGQGFLRPECDSGDGAHLSNEGHAHLLQQVLGADIPGALACAACEADYWVRRVPALAHENERRWRTASLWQRLEALGRLVRLPNLLIVALAQAVPYWGILQPALARPRLGNAGFSLLAGATVLAAAAGYVLNDYRDQPMDALNRAQRVIIGQSWSAQAALWLCAVLAALSLAMAVAAAAVTDVWWLTMMFTGVLIALAAYTYRLKCTPLVGNVVIAALCGLVPLLPWWVEGVSWPYSAKSAPAKVEAWGWVFALFAFVTNLLREQVKTMEDAVGDATCGCDTLPVRWGLPLARRWAIATTALLAFLLGGLLWLALESGATLWLIGIGLVGWIVPCGALAVWLHRASERRHFTAVSTGIKVLMLVGIVGLLIGYWTMA